MTSIDASDGTRLFVTTWGEGRPLLLANSWALNSDMWNYVVPGLVGAGHRVVTFDRRGHGRSDRSATGYDDLDTFADDLAAVVDQLDLRDLTMVGHSLGGHEIVRYLTRHGDGDDRVSRLVLVAPTLPLMARTPDNPDGIDPAVLAASTAALRADVWQWCADNGGTFFGDTTVSAGMVDWLVRQIVDTPLKVLLDTAMLSTTVDMRAEVAKVDRSTLILHGDLDTSAPIDLTGRRTAKLIPDATLSVYPGAGHGLFVTHYDRLADDIVGFAAG